MTRVVHATTSLAFLVSSLAISACGSSSGSDDGSSSGAAGTSGSGGATGASGASASGGNGAAGKGGASSAGSGSPFNPPNLKIVDKSTSPTGLVVVALNPQYVAAANSAEIFGVVKNNGSTPVCFPYVNINLVVGGISVFSGKGQVDGVKYVLSDTDTLGLPCVPPGHQAGFYAIDNASAGADKPETAEVSFSFSNFNGAYPSPDYPLLSGSVMATMPLGGYGFSGSALITKSIHNVALTGYPRDGSGLPLGKLTAFHLDSLPPGNWTFTTDTGVKSPFNDVLVAIDYIDGP
jgi:hypothetical protein